MHNEGRDARGLEAGFALLRGQPVSPMFSKAKTAGRRGTKKSADQAPDGTTRTLNYSLKPMEAPMAKQMPVIAPHVDTSLRNLLAILAAGGKRDAEVEIERQVWPHSARRQVQAGVLRIIKDSAGEVVAFKRISRAKHVERGVEWRKTPSGHVHTMQLKRGRRGRVVPAGQLVTA